MATFIIIIIVVIIIVIIISVRWCPCAFRTLSHIVSRTLPCVPKSFRCSFLSLPEWPRLFFSSLFVNYTLIITKINKFNCYLITISKCYFSVRRLSVHFPVSFPIPYCVSRSRSLALPFPSGAFDCFSRVHFSAPVGVGHLAAVSSLSLPWLS